MHALSSTSWNLKSSFMVTVILCSNLNKTCLNLVSFVDKYINDNFFFQSVKVLGNLFFQFLIPVGPVIEFP